MSEEFGKTDAERWFERYLRDHGYSYDYEPDLGVGKHPDFVIERNGVKVVCEVKAFEQVPALQKKLEGRTAPVMASDDEVYGPIRSAVRQAAKQLKPLADAGLPLVVVLANPLGFVVHLNMERLIEAMFGNPGWAGKFDAEKGEVEDMKFEYGRDGKLRNDHPYISAVVILREIDLEDEYQRKWSEERQKDRPKLTLEKDGIDGFAKAVEEEVADWEEHQKTAEIPSGKQYAVEVLGTGSEKAVPLPENVFDCRRDKRVDVEREAPAE
jgi:hypothetical protein